jgi:hypothetical protein
MKHERRAVDSPLEMKGRRAATKSEEPAKRMS